MSSVRSVLDVRRQDALLDVFESFDVAVYSIPTLNAPEYTIADYGSLESVPVSFDSEDYLS